MPRSETPSVADAVRVLAAPGSVLALVVLAVNDQVLKEAWPGWVTGKLSDVAGLVFAPLLLAAFLSLLRVPRALEVALVATGVGFVFCKTSASGAAMTSAVWSLFGPPTMIRADVTDLMALPALAAAWWIARDARRRARRPWRKVVTLAAGTALVPCGVLATAATSPCSTDEGSEHVTRVVGEFPGRPQGDEERLVVGSGHSVEYAIDAARAFSRPDVVLSAEDRTSTVECDPTDPERCWRIEPGGTRIEVTDDGGSTWSTELQLSEEQVGILAEEVGESCGEPAVVATRDLGVLPVEDGEPVVLVVLGRAGASVRDETGDWELWTRQEIFEETYTDPPAPRKVTPLDQGGADPSGESPGESGLPPPTQSPSQSPSRSPSESSTQSCPSPTPTTVTPHPSNGPPTTYDVCP